MLDKINVGVIARQHIDTLKDSGTGKRSLGDLLILWIAPGALACAVTLAGVRIDKEMANILGTAVSILAGLLFNLMILIYTVIDKVKNETDEFRRLEKMGLLKETYANISFCILVAIVTLLPLVVAAGEHPPIQPYVTFLIVFLSLVFMFTLLMVLKRVHILLTNQFDE